MFKAGTSSQSPFSYHFVHIANVIFPPPQIVCANENAQLMQSYAASTNALVTDKLTTILKDWAKAKAAYYDMDNKIAQVRFHRGGNVFFLLIVS